MRKTLVVIVIFLLSFGYAYADLDPGAEVPNPTLTAPDGKKYQLHDLFKTVTVLHLWECN